MGKRDSLSYKKILLALGAELISTYTHTQAHSYMNPARPVMRMFLGVYFFSTLLLLLMVLLVGGWVLWLYICVCECFECRKVRSLINCTHFEV